MKNLNTIKSQLRRAFTIVELVVVIAVIAALAAILIPTFVNVVNSANEASDVSMIYNINLSLATESDIETPEQALDIAAETGYNIEKLTPSSEGEIVYDEYTNTFALISTEGEVVYPTSNSSLADRLNATTTWYFVSSQEEIDADVAAGYLYRSYIITGTWGTVNYSGYGQIDTSRATIISGTIAGVQTTGGSGAVNNVTLGSKRATANTTENNKDTIILNITSGHGVYIYPSASVTYVIYCEAGYKYDTTSNIAANYTIKLGDEEPDPYIGVSTSDDSTFFTYAGIDIYAKYQEAVEEAGDDTTVTFVLESGTEKYPYLIDDLSAIGTKASASSLDTVYFQLTADISITADIEVSVDKNIVLNGSEAGNNIELNNYIFKLLTNNDVTIENVNITTSKSYTSIASGSRPFVIGGISINVIECTFTGTAPGDYVFEAYANEQSANIVIDNCTFTNAIVALNKIGSGTISVNDTTFKAEGAASSSASGIATNSCNELTINLTRCNFAGLIRYGVYNQGSVTVNFDTVNFNVEFQWTTAENLVSALTGASSDITDVCKFFLSGSASYTINSNVNSSFTYTYSGTTTDISADYAVENN